MSGECEKCSEHVMDCTCDKLGIDIEAEKNQCDGWIPRKWVPKEEAKKLLGLPEKEDLECKAALHGFDRSGLKE